MSLPTFWSSSDRATSLEVPDNLLVCRYSGTSNDSGTVRANRPIPTSCGAFYFEVTITGVGSNGEIGVGLCTKKVALNRLPGWEVESMGYHGDDGNKFRGTGTGIQYGPKYTTGDVIGCCITFSDHSVFFTKNGRRLGTAFTDVKEKDLYPCVGMRNTGESVEVNFGSEPFQFDFKGYMNDLKLAVREKIDQERIPGIHSLMNRLVLSYLYQGEYPQTAQTFSRMLASSDVPAFTPSNPQGEPSPATTTSSGKKAAKVEDMDATVGDEANGDASGSRAVSGSSSRDVPLDEYLFDQLTPERIEQMQMRERVAQSIRKGNVSSTIQLLETKYKALVTGQHEVGFLLRCQQYIDMLNGLEKNPSGTQDVIAFGRKELSPWLTSSSTIASKAKDVLSLIAYLKMDKSLWPASAVRLMSEEHRDEVARKVVLAMLVHDGYSRVAPLETLLRYTQAALEAAKEGGSGNAALVDMDSILEL